MGAPQAFEDSDQQAIRRKKDKLSVDVVIKYFQRLTGMNIPDWRNFQTNTILGFERCTKDFVKPPAEFETIWDI